ncbi:hypothetical protein, partial [Enterococcus faecalis]|uniref:hypothetical protein n=1 Tax=Enterococcus faecalis TaxID=1351 RepID=UPI000AE1B501
KGCYMAFYLLHNYMDFIDVEIFYFIKPKYLKTYLTLVDNILNEHAYFKLLYICINITSPITKVVGFWEGITINPLENL